MWYECQKCQWEGEVVTRPRCLACCAKRQREWRHRNREKIRELNRNYRRRFRENRREEFNAKRQQRRNPKGNAEMRQRRLEWIRSGDATREQLIEIYEKAKGLCNYCGAHVQARFSPLDPHGFDHVLPRVRGGKHTVSNIVVCCGLCNGLKGASAEPPVRKIDQQPTTS